MSAIMESRALLFSTSIDIPADTRGRIVDLLNVRLADTIDLKTQAKHAHWNVKGKEFFALHQMFDTIAEHCEQHSDLLAERVTALGGVAQGVVRLVVSNSSVLEYDLSAIAGEQHIRAVAKGLASFSRQARANIELAEKLRDKATADLLTEIVRQADKDLWFVELISCPNREQGVRHPTSAGTRQRQVLRGNDPRSGERWVRNLGNPC